MTKDEATVRRAQIERTLNHVCTEIEILEQQRDELDKEDVALWEQFFANEYKVTE